MYLDSCTCTVLMHIEPIFEVVTHKYTVLFPQTEDPFFSCPHYSNLILHAEGSKKMCMLTTCI